MHNLSSYYSVPVAELVFGGTVDCTNHIREMADTQVDATCLTEKTVIERFLVWLGDLGGITDGLAVFTFGVAVPHAVEGLLASKEVICLLLTHLSVADFETHAVVSALSVAVTKETDLARRWDHSFNIEADVVLSSFALLEMKIIVDETIVKSLWISG